MSLNKIRAILIINAKKASKKGMGKTKGWTDEARKKAALTRKAKAKVKSGPDKEFNKTLAGVKIRRISDGGRAVMGVIKSSHDDVGKTLKKAGYKVHPAGSGPWTTTHVNKQGHQIQVSKKSNRLGTEVSFYPKTKD